MRDFLQDSCYVNTSKGVHYAYFLKLHLILYFRASFQLFINILTSFKRVDFIPTDKRTAEILTQIKQSLCKRRSKSKTQILPLQQTSVMKKTVYLGLFIFN